MQVPSTLDAVDYFVLKIKIRLFCLIFQFKAAIRTVNPREEKYMQPDPKFKISVSVFVGVTV